MMTRAILRITLLISFIMIATVTCILLLGDFRLSQVLAFESAQTIYVMDVDHGLTLQLAHDNEVNSGWSWDGNQIVSGGQDAANNTKIDNTSRAKDSGQGDVENPVLSPDGQQIVFASSRDGNWEIYQADHNGDNLRRLTNRSSMDTAPDWSPDGTQIAFASDRAGNLDIFVMDTDGENLRNISNSREIDNYPVWSPNGQYIAFVSFYGGPHEIHVLQLDGTELRRLTYRPTNDHNPLWRP